MLFGVCMYCYHKLLKSLSYTVKNLLHENIDFIKKNISRIHYAFNLNYEYFIEFALIFCHDKLIWDKFL